MDQALLTLCAAAAAGAILVSISGRLRIPPIVLLLIGGVLLGPEGFGLIDAMALGSGLKLVVGMTVAVILFEGGMTLDFEGARTSTKVITRMLTLGVLVTWVGAAGMIYWLFDSSLSIAILCGSLIVVTGPTVVAPILRRMNIQDRLKHILFWESVLVDAIGVFLAVLCFEWISPAGADDSWSPLIRFGIRVGAGGGIGVGVGIGLVYLLNKHMIQDEYVNIVVLGVSLLTYAIAETVLHETGVLAVIIAGFCLSIGRPRQLRQLKHFKLELTELGIGTLFILLAGTLRLSQFSELGWGLVAAVAILSVVIRPVAIALSTWGHGFSWQEKIFLSWVAPRGIVAAFLASFFALELGADEAMAMEAQLVHTFTFAVIGATVIVQGLSAPYVAKLLDLEKEKPNRWLIVAEPSITEPMTRVFQEAGVEVVGVALRHGEGIHEDTDTIINADPFDRNLLDHPKCQDIANVIAISPNLYFNEMVCERWADSVGTKHCFHWSDVTKNKNVRLMGNPVWSHADAPSELISKLESGGLVFDKVEIAEPSQRLGKYTVPLLRHRGDQTEILGDNTDIEYQVGDQILVLRKLVPGLKDLIQSAVFFKTSEDFETVVMALLSRAQEHQPDLPVDELRSLILEREKTMPTAVGSGVAIPHVYHEGFSQTQCYLASVPGGVSQYSQDNQSIRLVFLVLSPSGKAEVHLQSLATIARLCGDSEYLEQLESQQSEDGLLATIRERE